MNLNFFKINFFWIIIHNLSSECHSGHCPKDWLHIPATAIILLLGKKNME